MQSFGRNGYGPKIGGLCPFRGRGAGSSSNTMWPDSRPRLEGARYKYLTSCSCLLTPPQPSVTHTFAHIIRLLPSWVNATGTAITKASAYRSRVGWTPARRIHTYMLSHRCLSCLVCPVLSVTLVYCDQTVRRIKMKLGTQVGLGPGHIVLDGDPDILPQKWRGVPLLSFRPISIVAKRWTHQDTTWYGGRPQPR